MDQNLLALLMASGGGSGAAFANWCYENSAVPGSATTTFTAADVGEPHTTRRVVVAIGCIDAIAYANAAPSSVTVGGVSATLLKGQALSSYLHTSLWMVDLPSGATANVVVVNPGTVSNVAVSLYSLYGAKGAGFATKSVSSASPGTMSRGSISVPKNGVLIAGGVSSLNQINDVNITADLALAFGSYYLHTGHGEGYAAGSSAVQLFYANAACMASFSPGSAKVGDIVFAGKAFEEAAALGRVPAHKPGDLLLAFAYNNSSTTVPTLPAGWTSIVAPAGAGASAMRVAYKVATSSAETVTGFTNATVLDVHVYHGCSSASPIGGSATQNGTSNTVTYPALTMSVTDGTSRVVLFAGRREYAALETAPAGTVLRSNREGGGYEVAGFDSNGGVASWTSRTAAAGGSSTQWFTCAIELKKGT